MNLTKLKLVQGSDGESYWYILYCHEWTWPTKVDHICETVHDIKVLHPQLKICACLGLTNEEQAEKLKEGCGSL